MNNNNTEISTSNLYKAFSEFRKLRESEFLQSYALLELFPACESFINLFPEDFSSIPTFAVLLNLESEPYIVLEWKFPDLSKSILVRISQFGTRAGVLDNEESSDKVDKLLEKSPYNLFFLDKDLFRLNDESREDMVKVIQNTLVLLFIQNTLVLLSGNQSFCSELIDNPKKQIPNNLFDIGGRLIKISQKE